MKNDCRVICSRCLGPCAVTRSLVDYAGPSVVVVPKRTEAGLSQLVDSALARIMMEAVYRLRIQQSTEERMRGQAFTFESAQR